MHKPLRTTSVLGAIVCIVSAISVMAAAPLIMQTYRFTALAYPGALTTEAQAINGNGDIVGWWLDSSRAFHAFLLSGGDYHSFDVPGALGTFATAINDDGTIAGGYSQRTTLGECCESHGFVRTPDRQFRTIDYPSATSDFQTTFLYGINNAGHVVGSYNEWVNGSSRGIHSFMFDGAAFAQIDFPTPADRVHDPVTYASGINDAGEIVGGYNADDEYETRHGFVLRNGVYSTFDVPSDLYSFTDLFGVNNRGEIVGETSACASSGFLYTPRRGFVCIAGTPIRKPEVVPSLVIGLNDLGQMVGLARSEPSDGVVRSFLATLPPARR